MPTCFLVLNWKQQPVSGVNVTADFAGTRRQVTSGADGIARFAEDIPESAKVYAVGDTTVTRVPCAETKEPVPVPGGETVIGTVGQSCDILEKYMFERAWYKHRNRYTGYGSSWDSELDDARHKAYEDKSCNDAPPPPPRGVDDVQKDVDILRGTISMIEGRVQDIVTSITEMGKALDAVKASIPGLITAALEPALKPVYAAIDALKTGTQTMIDTALKSVYTAIDNLKAWITDNVFELLMKKLDQGAKDASRK